MMTLKVFIEQDQITLGLLKKERVIDSETALYYHDLSDVLITTLDKLLKRNNIDTTALNSFKMLGNVGKNSTSHKVAAAFLEGLKAKT
jgi:hypothetical protein